MMPRMMSRWKNAIRAKARSERGESITEVLVAIVVSGLAILMLATVIATAVNVNQASRKAMNDYYAANNDVVSGALTTTGTVTLTSDGASVSLAGDSSISVTCYAGEQAGDTPVVSYVAQESGATG